MIKTQAESMRQTPASEKQRKEMVGILSTPRPGWEEKTHWPSQTAIKKNKEQNKTGA